MQNVKYTSSGKEPKLPNTAAYSEYNKFTTTPLENVLIIFDFLSIQSQSLHHFGPANNYWMDDMDVCRDSHGPQRMNLTDISDPLTFPQT